MYRCCKWMSKILNSPDLPPTRLKWTAQMTLKYVQTFKIKKLQSRVTCQTEILIDVYFPVKKVSKVGVRCTLTCYLWRLAVASDISHIRFHSSINESFSK